MSESYRIRKRPAHPTGSSNRSYTNEDLSTDEHSSLPGTATFIMGDDGSITRKSKGPRRRRRYSPQRRSEVAKVRKVGACEQCRNRKVKCTHVLPTPADARVESTPAPKLSPQDIPFPFEFENPYLPPSWDGDSGQLLQPDETQPPDSSANEGADLILSVPVPTARRNRLARDIHGYEKVIDDGSSNGAVKSFSNSSTWAQSLPWALAETNEDLYSQPSTTYACSNTVLSFDKNPLPYTPASTNADLSALEAPLACLHVDCGTKRYVTSQNPPTNMVCSHPEVFESPTQLLQGHLEGEYLPDADNIPVMVSDHKSSGGFGPSARFWQQARVNMGGSYRRNHMQRVHKTNLEPSLRRESSRMQRRHSNRTVDDPVQEFQSLPNVAGPNPVFNSPTSDSGISFQRLAGQSGLVMKHLNVQNVVAQGQSHFTNSLTPSPGDQFTRSFQMADPSQVFQASNRITEGPLRHALLQGQSEMLMMAQTFSPSLAVLDRSLNQQSQLSNTFNQDSFDPYGNSSFTTINPNPQSQFSFANMHESAWSEQGPSTSMDPMNDYINDYAPSSYLLEARDQQFPDFMTDRSLLNFPIPPETTKHPTSVMSSQAMLKAAPNAGIYFAPRDFNSNRTLSQRNSFPSLCFSTMSSSGADESLVGPTEAPNLFNDKYTNEWDNTNDDMM